MAQNDGIVENLVTQFSSALDCLRELVQNSIDAGSPQVEVWMEFERGEQSVGTISLHVDDFGEGMDEQIIDNQLTTLFASAKENDLTKIGKFGIGFVSVFAMKPKGILLHTGRGGEYWEVFFYEDRSFSKTKLDFPVEGTQITLFLEGGVHRYRELVRDVRHTLKHWCRHSETQITFEDRSPPPGKMAALEPINEPFEVEGDCMVRVEHQGSELVLAYTATPSYGFYNRGLALAYSKQGEDILFERAPRYRQICFKIKSRYLEHTLSRETIMRDVNYEKAMALLDDAVCGELLAALCTELEQLAAVPSWSFEQVRRYNHLMGVLLNEPATLFERFEQRPILRALHGAPRSLEAAFAQWEDHGALLFAERPTRLSEHLNTQGVQVIYGLAPSQLAHATSSTAPGALFARYASARIAQRSSFRIEQWINQNVYALFEDRLALMRQSLCSPEQLYLPVELGADEQPEDRALLKRASALLAHIDAGYGKLSTCRPSHYMEQPPLFVVAPKLAQFMAIPPAMSKRKDTLQVAVNIAHPHYRQIREVAKSKPALAAYMLAKGLLLDEDRLLERDINLMKIALA